MKNIALFILLVFTSHFKSIQCASADDGSWTTYTAGINIRKMVVSEESLWFITYDGFYCLSLREKTFEPVVSKGRVLKNIVDVIVDSKGNVAVVTQLGEVGVFNGESWNFTFSPFHHDLLSPKIAITSDGKIWLGTMSYGLFVYENDSWTPMNEPEEEGIIKGVPYGITSISVDHDDRIWIGSIYGIFQYNEGTWTKFMWGDGHNNDIISEFEITQDGSVLACSRKFVYKFEEGKWTVVPENDTFEKNGISSITTDSDGSIWTGTYGGGICRFKDSSWKAFTIDDGLPSNGINAVTAVNNGVVYAASNDGSLLFFNGESWSYMVFQNGLASNTIKSIMVKSDGTMLIGTSEGLSINDGEKWFVLNSNYGLAGSIVLDMAEDSNGDIWFGTYGGVSLYSNGEWTSWTKRETGLEESFNGISSIAIDSNGIVWAGSYMSGVYRFDGISWTQVANYYNVRAIAVDNSDNVWVGTRNDGVCRYDGESWTQFTEADGVGKNYVKDIAIDSFGRIWCGTFEGGISVYDGEKWMTFTTFDGLPTNYIPAVAIDSNDIVWAGTWGYGVCRFDGKTWVTFTENDGLAQNHVNSIAFDKRGAVYFGTRSGLSKYDPDATIVEENHINDEVIIFTNYPNPFNLTTRITFTLPSSGFTTLFIYSIIGQKVCELVSETMMPGTHSVIWDGKDTYGNPVSSGIYISKLTTKRNVTFNKMMLIE